MVSPQNRMLSNISNEIVGTLVLSEAILDVVVNTGLAVIDTTYKAQKIFVIGLLEGLAENPVTKKISLPEEELDKSIEMIRKTMAQSNPEFCKKLLPI